MQRIETLDDPRVADYRNLRDRTLRGESVFVAEGKLLVERLLASAIETVSVFVAEEFLHSLPPKLPPQVDVFTAPERLLLDIVGFNFHRGILAIGRRPAITPLHELLASAAYGVGAPQDDRLTRRAAPAEGPAAAIRLVACPEITKPENMGLIFRSAAAFGLDGVLLGPRCCDPFSRRCLRVSMGAVFQMPFRKGEDFANDLQRLVDDWDVQLIAATLDPSAEPLASFDCPARAAVLVGNEFDGLHDDWLARCRHRVTIPMHSHVDSLNLGVAAGIFFYALTQGRAQRA